jgi:hypothetical protein
MRGVEKWMRAVSVVKAGSARVDTMDELGLSTANGKR